MTTRGVFSRLALKEAVVLKPRQLDKRYEESVADILKSKYEGICSHNGYIRPGSIELTGVSSGNVRAFTLNGDVEFMAQFTAEVCCPSIGMLLRAKVVNINRLGIMAVVSDSQDTILEIIIVKGFDGTKMTDNGDARLNDVQIGHDVLVEVLGKRFQLNDKKISIVGKIIFDNAKKQEIEEGDGHDMSLMIDAGSDGDVEDEVVADVDESVKDSSDEESGEDDVEEDDVDDDFGQDDVQSEDTDAD